MWKEKLPVLIWVEKKKKRNEEKNFFYENEDNIKDNRTTFIFIICMNCIQNDCN